MLVCVLFFIQSIGLARELAAPVFEQSNNLNVLVIVKRVKAAEIMGGCES